MHGARWFFSAGTGALIGVAVIVAIDLSHRLLGKSAKPATEPADRAASPLQRILIHDWRTKTAIIVGTMAVYTLIAYAHQPTHLPDAAPPQADAADTLDTGPIPITVGGTTLTFVPPATYCTYPAPLMQSVLIQQAKVNADNVIYAAFGDCSELRDTLASQTRMRDFGLLMTPKALLTQKYDSKSLDQLAAASVDPSTVKETLDQRFNTAESKLSLQSFSALGIVDRDDRATYFAYLSKSQDANGAFSQACVMAMLQIKGRLLTYYIYSDYTKDPRSVMLGLVQKAKAGVADLAQHNGA
jgi:hypothetical protein